MLGVYRIQPSGSVGYAPFPDTKPPINLLYVGIGTILALGAVAAFVYWNEGRR